MTALQKHSRFTQIYQFRNTKTASSVVSVNFKQISCVSLLPTVMTSEAYSEPIQTSKMELFAKSAS